MLIEWLQVGVRKITECWLIDWLQGGVGKSTVTTQLALTAQKVFICNKISKFSNFLIK